LPTFDSIVEKLEELLAKSVNTSYVIAMVGAKSANIDASEKFVSFIQEDSMVGVGLRSLADTIPTTPLILLQCNSKNRKHCIN
jgi:hypothetical protein